MKSFKYQSFVLIFIAFILGFSEFIIVGILNDLATAFAENVSTVGYLVTIFAFIYAFSTPIITSFIGKRKLLPVLILFMGVFTLGNFLTAFAPTYLWLSISRIIVASVSGATISVAMALGTYLAPMEKRAWLISWIYSGFSIASVFGVPLGTWLSNQFGWRSAFYLITLLGILAMILSAVVLPAHLRQATTQSKHFFSQFTIFTNRQIQLSVVIAMCSLASIYTVYTYLRPIFTTNLQIPFSLITVLFTLYGFMSLISNQLSGKIAENRGLVTMSKIYVFQIVLLLCLPLLLQSTIFGIADIMLLGLTMYLFNAPVQMHILSIAEKDFPQSLVLASSLNSIFANVGIAFGSAVGSIIVKQFGTKYVSFGGALFTMITLAALFMLNKLILSTPTNK